MTKRMMIDASHAEETRVVVIDGSRLEDFDVETLAKRQLKGNIYLAKVVRVEPSLQAAFVEYGGNRHGFLAFSEIHPDYYQIPVADRQRLLEMEAEEARREEEEADLEMALDQAHAEAPVHDAPADDASGYEADASSSPDAGVGSGEPQPARDPGHDVTGAHVAARGASSGITQPGGSTTTDGQASATEVVADPVAAGSPVSDAPPGQASDAAQDDMAATDGSPAAMPLAIEPDALSGPVENARQADGTPGIDQPPAAPKSDESRSAATDEGQQEAAPEQPKQMAQSPEAAELFSSGGTDERDTGPQEAYQAGSAAQMRRGDAGEDAGDGAAGDYDDDDAGLNAPAPETVGGDQDSGEDRGEHRIAPRFLRNYKIQEVIRRRQILLVQVVKEERGTKGAALTTYISLAGRFSVLMPNSPRGGGISRKITSATDRRRLKEVMTELAIPRGMGLIVRTAGANRPKPEIKRDCEYLLRLWDDIRDHTMNSVAPALIYEEASLIKRAIRDVYSRDVDDILVDGEEGWRAAHDFMRMLMPTHAKKVQLWRDPMPLFARFQVEAQLDSMLLPTVQLRSGGYLVINQAEALVAIDVNSGRSTRERGIEETALRTNLEAADEVARQLRLRDLAGLIVIDFIDMDHRKHNAMVERRLKEALKNDRARIQIGQISHFGLLEMSRQRLRPSLAETSFVGCPHCGGTGHVRSTESAAIHVLRGIEDEGGKRRAAEIVVHVATPIALYLLNHKRERLREIEHRYAMRVIIAADDSQFASHYRIERVRPQIVAEALPVITPDVPQITAPVASAVAEDESDQDEDGDEEDDDAVDGRADESAPEGTRETAEEAEHRRRRRRRRRRGRRDDVPGVSSDAEGTDAPPPVATGTAGSVELVSQAAMAIESADQAVMSDAETMGSSAPDFAASASAAPIMATSDAPTVGVGASGDAETGSAAEFTEGVPEPVETTGGDEDARNRRRGRRGGRRRRREPGDGELTPVAEPGAEQPEVPHYSGPTPANPFGGQAFDIFDVLDQAERNVPASRERVAPLPSPVVDRDAPRGSVYPTVQPAEPSRADVMTSAAGDTPGLSEVASRQSGVTVTSLDIEAVIPVVDEEVAAATAMQRGGATTPAEMDDADGGSVTGAQAAAEAAPMGAAAQPYASGPALADTQNQSEAGEPGSIGTHGPADTAEPVPADPEGRSSAAGAVAADAQNLPLEGGAPATGLDPLAGKDEQVASDDAIANQAAPEPALTQPLEVAASGQSTATIAMTPGSQADAASNSSAETPDVAVNVTSAGAEETTTSALADTAEPQAEAAIKPIVIGGAETTPLEKKRGWWRR